MCIGPTVGGRVSDSPIRFISFPISDNRYGPLIPPHTQGGDMFDPFHMTDQSKYKSKSTIFP